MIRVLMKIIVIIIMKLNSGNVIKLNGEFSDVSTVFNIPSLKVTTLRDGSLSFPEIYIEGIWDPSLYKSVL